VGAESGVLRRQRVRRDQVRGVVGVETNRLEVLVETRWM
jgi:hypothetical protein